MRVIFFASPINTNQKPKSIPDSESEEAKWLSIDEINKIAVKNPGLRGPELLEWSKYVESGGIIYPLSLLNKEEEPIPSQSEILLNFTSPFKTDYKTNNIVSSLSETIKDIESNNDLNLRQSLLNGIDPNSIINKKQWTLLHLAIKYNYEYCVNALLLSGADLGLYTINKRNAIHFAAQSTPSIVTMLLIRMQSLPVAKRKEYINFQDCEGDTHLHVTARYYSKSKILIGAIWKLLEEYGANSKIMNKEGLTAEDLANMTSFNL